MFAAARPPAAWSPDRNRCARGSSRFRSSIAGQDSLASRSFFCCLGSDRADIGKALLRQRHASGDVAGAAPHAILPQHRGLRPPLGPTPPPAPPPPVHVRPPKGAL